MSTAVVQVPVSVDLYQRLVQAAGHQAKSVETLLSETLQVTLPTAEDIPTALRVEIDGLDALSNKRLHQIAHANMEDEDARELDQLLDWQNMRQLTVQEQEKLATLQANYGRILLRKARAFAILAERGIPLPL